MFFDPMYFLFVGPALILSLVAQFWVKSAFNKYSQVGIQRGMSGAEVAQFIVRQANLGVRVERVQGFLSDHYDPTQKVLRLSPAVYDGRSISSVGVAAHEAGHALQHAKNYAPLAWRSALVPATKIGSMLSFPVLMIGFLMSSLGLIKIGIILFSAAVLFQIVTLPVEFDASRRAVAVVSSQGIVTQQELSGVKKVLTAAAMTYVAAAISSIATLLYYLFRAGLLGGSRND
ncbi:MAG: zinc metallopeptidase [Candidatus Eisenbacteria bacterium]|uniref:Zinc metallopeptidase n=1 Tax=Eiseniibacteriota bacterium TaxID=2212470 RepID=A0A956NC46_UNCEI|nr:zinc metallopeptidase [Candidatus Eisenbacteria bacterium]